MKISILIINFNKEKFIKNTLRSCINQRYNNFEIIIVDDQSTDNSKHVLKEYKKKYKNIRIFFKKGKKVPFPAINHFNAVKFGLNKCDGKVVCLLDGDDIFHKNKLKEVNLFFLKNSAEKIVFNKPKFLIENKLFYPKKNYKRRFNKWPYHPPFSCISIKKVFLKKILKKYNNYEYRDTWLDFIISSVMCLEYNSFNLIDKYLSIYVITNLGYEKKLYSNFNSRWWLRRKQAHNFVSNIEAKVFYNKYLSTDYYITNLINFFLNLKIFKF